MEFGWEVVISFSLSSSSSAEKGIRSDTGGKPITIIRIIQVFHTQEPAVELNQLFDTAWHLCTKFLAYLEKRDIRTKRRHKFLLWNRFQSRKTIPPREQCVLETAFGIRNVEIFGFFKARNGAITNPKGGNIKHFRMWFLSLKISSRAFFCQNYVKRLLLVLDLNFCKAFEVKYLSKQIQNPSNHRWLKACREMACTCCNFPNKLDTQDPKGTFRNLCTIFSGMKTFVTAWYLFGVSEYGCKTQSTP